MLSRLFCLWMTFTFLDKIFPLIHVSVRWFSSVIVLFSSLISLSSLEIVANLTHSPRHPNRVRNMYYILSSNGGESPKHSLHGQQLRPLRFKYYNLLWPTSQKPPCPGLHCSCTNFLFSCFVLHRLWLSTGRCFHFACTSCECLTNKVLNLDDL